MHGIRSFCVFPLQSIEHLVASAVNSIADRQILNNCIDSRGQSGKILLMLMPNWSNLMINRKIFRAFLDFSLNSDLKMKKNVRSFLTKCSNGIFSSAEESEFC